MDVFFLSFSLYFFSFSHSFFLSSFLSAFSLLSSALFSTSQFYYGSHCSSESLFLFFWGWPGEVSMCVSPGTVCVHPCLDMWLCLVLAALCTHQMFTYIILLLVGHRFQRRLSLLFQHHLHLFNNTTAWLSSFLRDFVCQSKRSLVTAIKAAALCNKSIRIVENCCDRHIDSYLFFMWYYDAILRNSFGHLSKLRDTPLPTFSHSISQYAPQLMNRWWMHVQVTFHLKIKRKWLFFK